ncbi:MAG: aldo/keto reductase [Actinomycetota bacterium]|nr:aldo/keto reductase [Actinomycetota bacterium]
MSEDRSRPTLVLGTAQLDSAYGIANRFDGGSRNRALALLREAESLDVSALDTSPSYGSAESLIGEAQLSIDVYTKIQRGISPKDSVLASLHRLKRTSVKGVLVHESSLVLKDAEGVIEKTAALVEEGLAECAGCSTYTPAEFAAAIANPLIRIIQAPVNAADQRLSRSGLLEEAKNHGKVVFARSVFLQGALLLDEKDIPEPLSPLRQVVATIDSCLEGHPEAISRAAVLLLYVRDLPGVSGVVIGCENPRQLRSNVSIMSSRTVLNRELLANLPSVPSDVLDPRYWQIRV